MSGPETMEITLHFNFTICHISTETPLTCILFKDGQTKTSQTSEIFQEQSWHYSVGFSRAKRQWD